MFIYKNNTLYLLFLPLIKAMRGAMRRRSPPGGVIKRYSLESISDGGLMRVL
jgi:hypothetical protein